MCGFHIMYISSVVLCEQCVVGVVGVMVVSGVQLLSVCVGSGRFCVDSMFVIVFWFDVCVEFPFCPDECSPHGSVVRLAVFVPGCWRG
jgi:hypothetical protein